MPGQCLIAVAHADKIQCQRLRWCRHRLRPLSRLRWLPQAIPCGARPIWRKPTLFLTYHSVSGSASSRSDMSVVSVISMYGRTRRSILSAITEHFVAGQHPVFKQKGVGYVRDYS